MSTNDPAFSSLCVSESKILEYLLCFDRMPGAAKAKFFYSFGFKRQSWSKFAECLIIHGKEGQIARRIESIYGIKWEVHGPIETPDGRNPMICTVWQRDKDKLETRLITAYPIEI